MLTRTILERSGPAALIRRQFVGVSGQVCSTTYEIAGPHPGHFRNLVEAKAAFDQASTVATGDPA